MRDVRRGGRAARDAIEKRRKEVHRNGITRGGRRTIKVGYQDEYFISSATMQPAFISARVALALIALADRDESARFVLMAPMSTSNTPS